MELHSDGTYKVPVHIVHSVPHACHHVVHHCKRVPEEIHVLQRHSN